MTLREVEQLPEARCCRGLLDYVKHMRDERLTDAQLAEVRRRLADPARELVPHAEARARIVLLGS